MYLDDEGNAVSDLSRYHGLAVGVPGTVAGLLKALEEHGTMSREQVMAPAIALAEDGIEVTAGLSVAHCVERSLAKVAQYQKSVF